MRLSPVEETFRILGETYQKKTHQNYGIDDKGRSVN